MTTTLPWRNRRRTPVVVLLIAFVSLCLLAFSPASHASAAAGDGWPPIGPDSGADGSILVHPTDPNRIFITSNEGLFRSDDGGEHWRTLYIRKGWSDSLWEVTLHPSDPETLYALFQRGFSFPYSYELFVSHDGGESWLFQFSPPSPDDDANWIGPTLAIASSAPETLYLFVNHQLHKSVDGGISWAQLGVSGHEITAISIAPSNAEIVYAATVGNTDWPRKILKSEDGGGSWISLDAPGGGWIPALSIHPADPETLFVSGYDSLFVSHDGGRSWAITGLDAWQSSNINISPTDPAIMYATAGGSAFKSEDGGANWRIIDADIPDAGRPWTASLAIHPTDPETLFINRSQFYPLTDLYGRGTSGKLYKSADGGDSWLFLDQGLLNTAVSDFAFSAKTGALYVTSGPGAFRRDADSHTWVPLNNELGEAPPMAYQIAISPGEPEVLYTVTWPASDDTLNVYRSEDEGENWTLAGATTAVGGPPRDMAIALTSPPSLYLVNAAGEVEKSRDGGGAWTVLEAGPDVAGEIAVDPTDPNRLYATNIRAPWGGLWRSPNGGGEWEELSLPGAPESSGIPGPLAVDLEGGVYIRMDALGPLLRSDDHGDSWETLDALPLRSILYAITFDPTDPSRIVIATDDGISISEDRGRSWLTAGQPISRRYPPLQVAVNPMIPQHLVVMNRWDGLYEREIVNQNTYLPLIGASDDDLGSGQIDPESSGAWVQSARLDPDGGSRVVVQPLELVTGLGNVQYWAAPTEGKFTVTMILSLGDRRVHCMHFPYYDRNTPTLSFPGQTEEYTFSFIAPEEVGRYNLTASIITGVAEPYESLCTTGDDWPSVLPPGATRNIGEIVVQE